MFRIHARDPHRTIKRSPIDSKSFGLENDSFAQAFAEGLLLGQYSFTAYKSKKNKNVQ